MLNELQESIIRQYVEYRINKVFSTVQSKQGRKLALILMMRFSEHANLLPEDVQAAIQQVFVLLQHPCPQNRTTGCSVPSSFPKESKSGITFVYYRDSAWELQTEGQGILNLTPHNNKVTRVDVVSFVKAHIANRFDQLNNAQEKALAEQEPRLPTLPMDVQKIIIDWSSQRVLPTYSLVCKQWHEHVDTKLLNTIARMFDVSHQDAGVIHGDAIDFIESLISVCQPDVIAYDDMLNHYFQMAHLLKRLITPSNLLRAFLTSDQNVDTFCQATSEEFNVADKKKAFHTVLAIKLLAVSPQIIFAADHAPKRFTVIRDIAVRLIECVFHGDDDASSAMRDRLLPLSEQFQAEFLVTEHELQLT